MKIKIAGVRDGQTGGSNKSMVVKLFASPSNDYVIGDSSKARLTIIDGD